MAKRRWAISFGDIYHGYNYDSLNYLIDIMHRFYSSYITELGKAGITGELEDKKKQMIRYEIIAKFCHYAETLGAFIYGYDKNYSARDRESKVLSTISDYKVSYIEDKYKSLTKGRISSLWKIQEQSLKNVFGYTSVTDPKYSNDVNESLLNIKKLLSEIYGCYCFYRNSYNSYKHGYRLWFAHDHKNNIDITLYIPSLRCKHIRKQRKYVPTDEKSLSLILNCSRYCRRLFDILIENERQLLAARKKRSKNVELSLLKKQNNNFEIQERTCSL
jgi:hypothetical protein